MLGNRLFSVAKTGYNCDIILKQKKMENTLNFANLPDEVQKRVILKEEENFKNFLKLAGLNDYYNLDHFDYDIKQKVSSKIYYQDHNTFFELIFNKI